MFRETRSPLRLPRTLRIRRRLRRRRPIPPLHRHHLNRHPIQRLHRRRPQQGPLPTKELDLDRLPFRGRVMGRYSVERSKMGSPMR
jgi:hypothetical protein